MTWSSGQGHLGHQVTRDEHGPPLGRERTHQVADPDDPLGIETVRRLVEGEEKEALPLAGDAVSVLVHDIALVPAPEPRGAKLGDLYAVGSAGNQSYRFDLSFDPHGALEATLVREYYPMRIFGGKALVAAPDGPWYDFADRFIPLVQQCRPCFDESAAVVTPVLDGHAPATVWHRLLIDGSIAPDSDVRISSRAADDLRELAVAAWNPEPRLHLRDDGSELPFALQATGDREGTWELLFQRAKGQFLQLRIELSGDGRTSPRLRGLRAYYPRFSYLDNYLPKVYRENPASASFLDRFLANLGGVRHCDRGPHRRIADPLRRTQRAGRDARLARALVRLRARPRLAQKRGDASSSATRWTSSASAAPCAGSS